MNREEYYFFTLNNMNLLKKIYVEGFILFNAIQNLY